MRTDDNLTTLLRESFTAATADLAPADDLASLVRRRHTAAQRRRAAVRIGVPAVAAASIAGIAVSTPSHHAAPAHPVAAPRLTPTPLSTTHLKTVSYRVAFPQGRFSTIGCVARSTDPSGHSWLLEDGNCGSGVSAVINTDATLPSSAAPISIAGLTGLYGRTDGDTRTVWAPNGNGGYCSLIVGAATSDSAIAAFFTPAS